VNVGKSPPLSEAIIVLEDARNRDTLVVVPCLNEAAHLPGLLEGLLRDANGALVVVADGGSTDGSQAIVTTMAATRRNLVLLHNSDRIQSAGVNLAARRHGAGCRWLVRIDAHAEYPEHFICRLREAASRSGATSVVVPMVTVGRACFQKAVAAAQNSVLGTGGAAHRHLGAGRWVDHGHHALFDLRLFMAAGGYDEGFAANEDAELDRRLLAAGGRIWLEPAAAITYFPRRTAASLFRQYRNYGRGRARNLRRHPAPVKLRQMLPLAVAPAILVGVLGVLLACFRTEGLLLCVPALSWLAGVLLAGVVVGVKAGTLCGAASGLAAATMHAGWSLGFLEEVTGRKALPPVPRPIAVEGEENISVVPIGPCKPAVA
jgi:succinoglycan biosynthesis protein ExoA